MTRTVSTTVTTAITATTEDNIDNDNNSKADSSSGKSNESPSDQTHLPSKETSPGNVNGDTKMNQTSSTVIDSATTTTQHYEHHTVESYEDAYFYEPGAYMEYLVEKTHDALGWNEDYDKNDGDNIGRPVSNEVDGRSAFVLLDIGGGTGNFAAELLQFHRTRHEAQTGQQSRTNRIVRVVDPFLEPTTTGSKDSSLMIEFVKASAEDFLTPLPPTNTATIDKDEKDHSVTTLSSDSTPSSSLSSSPSSMSWRADGYHQVLMKEVVHHLKSEDRAKIFHGMRDGLTQTNGSCHDTFQEKRYPSILIITRPQVDIDYPIWDSAKDVWKANQPSVDDIAADLRTAGFRHISQSQMSYPCSISLERWQDMIRSRFWSTFSHFSDDELEHFATVEIPILYKDKIYDDDGTSTLQFEDRLVFIHAR